mmetsp:Transcript_85567/g.228928  ORF Transcript_85567/g.228928 Transcript_85567/m.228928 type:complete len:210 (-) Transcript_85567:1500-2129(-)
MLSQACCSRRAASGRSRFSSITCWCVRASTSAGSARGSALAARSRQRMLRSIFWSTAMLPGLGPAMTWVRGGWPWTARAEGRPACCTFASATCCILLTLARTASAGFVACSAIFCSNTRCCASRAARAGPSAGAWASFVCTSSRSCCSRCRARFCWVRGMLGWTICTMARRTSAPVAGNDVCWPIAIRAQYTCITECPPRHSRVHTSAN